MITIATIPAPAACPAGPESTCAARTLDEALLYLAEVWPGHGAAPSLLAEFYQHAAEVYAAVEDDQRHMQARAAAYTINARLRAEHYAAQAMTTPAVGAPRPREPAWPALPPPRVGHATDRRSARCPR